MGVRPLSALCFALVPFGHPSVGIEHAQRWDAPDTMVRAG